MPNISFIGDTTWQKSEPDRWSIDSFGIDQLLVTYRGSVATQEAFRATFAKWQKHPTLKTMKLASIEDANASLNFPAIVLTYTGFKSGKVPVAKGKTGTSIQSASAHGINTEGRNISGTFQYQASQTTWTWFETQKPKEVCPPLEVLNKVNPLTRIVSHDISDDFDGKTRNNIPYSDFVILLNSLAVGIYVTDYQCEMVHPQPEELWACSATLDFKVIN